MPFTNYSVFLCIRLFLLASLIESFGVRQTAHLPLSFVIHLDTTARRNRHSIIRTASHIQDTVEDDDDENCVLSKIPADLEGIPIPFVDTSASASKSLGYIECFAESLANCMGVKYTIGTPCDNAVSLCYEDEAKSELVPIELDDPEMDDVFSIAESIVAEEFGEDLVLQRTPQTLTLVGELDDDDDEDNDNDNENDDEDENEDFNTEIDAESEKETDEEVELLLSFEHRGREYSLVRRLDPILLVGKSDPENLEKCTLLTSGESEKVVHLLEGLFLDEIKSDESPFAGKLV